MRTTLLVGRASGDLARLAEALSERGLATVAIRPDQLREVEVADHDFLLVCQDEKEFDPELRQQLTEWSTSLPVMMIEALDLTAERQAFWRQTDGLVDQIMCYRDTPVIMGTQALSRPGLSIWVLAASIGGPEALRQFLSGLSGPVNEALVLVQHIGVEFVRQLVRQLDQVCALPVRLVQQGDLIRPGVVHVIPGSQRFEADRMGQCSFSKCDQVSRFTPCIDDTVDALGQSFSGQLNMMIFSGMSTDGVAAAQQVADKGGEIWIQESSSCVVSSMVDGVHAQKETSFIGTPDALAGRFSQRHYLSQQESIKNGTLSS